MAQRTRLYAQLLVAQAALNTAGQVPADLLPSARELTLYVYFGPGTNGGSVTIEEAHSPTFTGTWATVGSAVNWAAADRVHAVSVTGAHLALRARISTGITGGTVSVWAVAN